MGEVYRAKDTRLDREVAIKVLPEHFADDLERLQRFEREAKSLASLNHTNVAQIYGVDQVEDTCFLVLELVPGETLEERLARGPLSIEEAIDVCGQIAEGLEAAHEASVIHRDLKPANVRITPDGKVKVLDFGLAKATGPPGEDGETESQTDGVLMTEEGRLLGTPTYMAPEQARGKPIDRRVDVWAFGCVLYECLTAKRAFPGETFSDVVASILSGEPDWAALPAGTPTRVERLLRRCLDKDKRTRLRDIGEGRIALAGAAEDPVAAAGKRGPPRLAWAVAALSLAVAVFALLREPSATPGAGAVEERTILAYGTGISGPRLSPTGAHVAFLRDGALAVRALESLETRSLSGTNGALSPFWSPDGTELGYARKRPGGGFTLHTVALEGGDVFEVAEVSEAQYLGGVWNREDEILFAVAGGEEVQGLLAVPAAGSVPPRRVLKPDPDREEYDFHDPQLLSDGRTVTMTLHGIEGFGSILVWDGGERHVLVEAGDDHTLLCAVDSPVSDHLVFERSGTNVGIWIVPFSLEEGAVLGQPEPLIPGGSLPSFDADGRLAYLGGVVREDPRVRRVDAQGEPSGEVVSPAFTDLRQPTLSPDGRRVAAMVQTEGNRDVWTFTLDGPTRTRLTRSEGSEGYPVWSTDGEALFIRSRDGLYVVEADGESEPTNLETEGFPRDLSPDGKWLLLEVRDDREISDIRVAEMRDGRPFEVRDFVATAAHEFAPAFSPGGDLVAYTTDATGRHEIVVRPFPTGGGSGVQISRAGGTHPRWAPEGDRLFFIAQEEGQPVLMGVTVTRAGDQVEVAGAPRRVFAGRTARSGLEAYTNRVYDVIGDGSEFLVVEEFTSGMPEVVLWEGWTAPTEVQPGGPPR